MLTQNEVKLFKLALYWYKRWDDACPDVGMGYSDQTLLWNLENQIGVTLSQADRNRILA